MSYSSRFAVKPGTTVDLARYDPGAVDGEDKKSARQQLKQFHRRLEKFQYRLYAEAKRSLLICLQAMDAAGKDGTIRAVFGPLNPQGTRVIAFKTPTAEELAHNFLWRIEKRTPARGEVVIFNRSHYEDVLIVRVRNLSPRSVWEKRYDAINDFERRLTENGTRILKFFLHISPEEQLARFKKRLEDPRRQWKISAADYEERRYWPDYMRAYETVLQRNSTAAAPWFVIPANHKWYRNLVVAGIVAETMAGMRLCLPAPGADLAEVRRQYHAAAALEIAR